jgi:parvulin-like peptidyl-prolyl isomerase
MKADRILAGLATAVFAATLTACSGGGDVATVNGASISRADFDAKLESAPSALGTLQQLVQAKLVEQYAQKNNITITEDDITKREDDVKANFPPGSWADVLKSHGLTEGDFRALLRQNAIIDKAVGKDIKISDAQIKQYFDKNHAAFDKPAQVQVRHILVPDLKTALKVEADLKGGKDFATEAKAVSMDPGSRDKGGDLGLVHHGQMVPSFEQAAFSQAVGVVGPPVKSPYGYHVIQVESKVPAVTATLANQHDRIESMLRQQQEAPQIQPFMQSLQTTATINVADPRFAAAFPSPQAVPSAAPTAAAPAATPTH